MPFSITGLGALRFLAKVLSACIPSNKGDNVFNLFNCARNYISPRRSFPCLIYFVPSPVSSQSFLMSALSPGKYIPPYHWRSCFFFFFERGNSEAMIFSLKSNFSRAILPEILSKFFHDIAPLKTPAKIAEVTKNHAPG